MTAKHADNAAGSVKFCASELRLAQGEPAAPQRGMRAVSGARSARGEWLKRNR